MKTRTELMNLSGRYKRAAEAMQKAAFALDDAVVETNGIDSGDRARAMFYEAANLSLSLANESRKLAEQVEAMPPDEEDAGDAMEVAQRPDRFEMV